MYRHNARKKNIKRKEVSKVKFITTFNPALPNIEAFPYNTFSVTYKPNKNLKEMVASSSHPKPIIKKIVLLLAVTKL